MSTPELVSQSQSLAPARRSRRKAIAWAMIAALAALAALFAVPIVGLAWFEREYAGRIYPGVWIGDLDVGGLTPDQAAQRVAQHYADRQLAVLEFDGSKWFARWPEIGLTVDASQAAHLAFEVGRAGALNARWRDWQTRRPVAVLHAFDADQARAFLLQKRADVYVPPRDARVEIDRAAGVARAIEAVPGRDLDVDATARDLHTLALAGQPIPVLTRVLAPGLPNVSQPVAQLNDWMNRPFAYRVWWNNDLITRPVSPQERAEWVDASLSSDHWQADWNPGGVRAFLAALNRELGETADLRVDEAVAMTGRAFERGDDSVWLVAPYRQHQYAIQAGDTFDGLSDRFGIPVARLLAANPDIWQGGFSIGQSITIPAQGIMLPLPIAPANLKHIEIDLTAQQLVAFDGSKPALSATISSGIPKWRTLVGVFQVLERVDEAYNKLARIKMPNWLSIYDIGVPGESMTNGIHALPVLGGGRRLWSGYLGRPVSFGCVVMGIEDSDFLYRWAELGTPVVIYGQTPPSPLNYDNLFEAQEKTEQPAAQPTPLP